NQFQDYRADMGAGKRNLVVRLGRARAVLVYLLLMFVPYAAVVGGVAGGVLSPYTLLALLTLPIAWKAIRTARAHHDDYLKLTPANAATVMVHMLVGVILALAYVLQRVAPLSL
ncbi:MAG: prenyltransferase, partial [Chloroflexi bacterium]|nr:prenyltransferase [Chloroflexota bacterium]